MNSYIGTSGFSYPKWKGKFYPAKMPANQMLGFYSARFRSVEINNSFYRLPSASALEAWASQVPTDFRFVLKAPQEITHRRRLVGVDQVVSSFLEVAGTLKERLGPLLFQLPPNFKKDIPRLRAFLALLTPGCRAAFEFRHPSWFDDEVFGLLRDRQTALCIADAEDDLEVPFVATADWGYLRLRRPDYDDAALKAWAERMQAQTWQDCFVFFKHEDSGKGPELASRLLELLAEGSGQSAKPKQAG
ncbi:MAG TPA: DUF72 domain-containing protein [Gemmata sp.]|jgi:uncharacterized protein YecE (DUF72 family)|nr:DUF72 domain-containing protein [Gemmata sp.]